MIDMKWVFPRSSFLTKSVTGRLMKLKDRLSCDSQFHPSTNDLLCDFQCFRYRGWISMRRNWRITTGIIWIITFVPEAIEILLWQSHWSIGACACAFYPPMPRKHLTRNAFWGYGTFQLIFGRFGVSPIVVEILPLAKILLMNFRFFFFLVGF